LIGEFQADSLMAGRYIKRKCHLIMSSDADIPVLVGDECIIINNYHGRKNLKIASTSKATLTNAIACLGVESQQRLMFGLLDAKFPLFEGLEDRRTRCLISIALGNDVLVGGVKGVGPTKMKKMMDSYKADIPIQMHIEQFMVFESKEKLTKEVLDVLVDAMVFEPCNTTPLQDKDSKKSVRRSYITGQPPSHLKKYSEEFAAFETVVDDDGPEVLSCKGPCDGGTHFFLAAFGSIQCHSCMGAICPLCTESIGSKSYCLSCYSLESLLPEDNVGGTHNNEDLPAKSFTEMKKALLDADFDGITELMPDDVKAAYTCYEIMKDSMEGLVCRVPLPLLPTSALNSNDHLEKILDIDFKEGGSFITDPSLDPHQIPQITRLLSSFVKFDEEKLTCNKWEKESPVFNVVPTMLVNIAARSCVDRGYRLPFPHR